MILYHVWFSFKPEVDAPAELEKVRAFLADLKNHGRVDHFRLTKNRAEAGQGKLPPYQITAEFCDRSRMGEAFAEVKRIGIHAGFHGAMIENVDHFVVEVFEDI